MKALRLDDIPGVKEAVAKARNEQFRTRQDGWLELLHDICGIKIRTMTVCDYVLLERERSPFINRCEPTEKDLALFLWILSPQFKPGKSKRIAAFLHGRKVHRLFCKDIPRTSEPAVIACFKYIDKMFADAPPTIKGGAESSLTYLTGWFDTLQSEYHCSEADVWAIGVPKMFQKLNAIMHRKNPNLPNFNQRTDRIKQEILNGLLEKRFTLDDLKNGKATFDLN
jgi:hypothetical protein